MFDSLLEAILIVMYVLKLSCFWFLLFHQVAVYRDIC